MFVWLFYTDIDIACLFDTDIDTNTDIVCLLDTDIDNDCLFGTDIYNVCLFDTDIDTDTNIALWQSFNGRCNIQKFQLLS